MDQVHSPESTEVAPADDQLNQKQNSKTQTCYEGVPTTIGKYRQHYEGYSNKPR